MQAKPGQQRINVAATLATLEGKARDEQIDDLEKIHQELTIRLNRAQA
ncbi:hypothetical protein [Trueperella pyogenes]